MAFKSLKNEEKKMKKAKMADLTSDHPTHLPKSDFIRFSLTYLPTPKNSNVIKINRNAPLDNQNLGIPLLH